MEQPRFQHQTELQKLKSEFDKLKNQEPKEHEFQHQPHVYVEQLQDYYEKTGELRAIIDKLEAKNTPKNPQQNAALLNVDKDGYGLN